MFQSFVASTTPEQGPPRLRLLRAHLKAQDVAGFLVPRADAHQGEYVAPGDERLAWLTGFTGSAGFAAILSERAGVFVDGRYRVQVRAQVDATFTPIDWPETQLHDWLSEHCAEGDRIGFDPWLHTAKQINTLSESLTPKRIHLHPMANAVDAIWHDRPGRPEGAAFDHPVSLAGLSSGQKREIVAEAIRKAGAASAVLTLPDDINWLLNIRGTDLPHLPVVQAFALVDASGAVRLFCDPAKLGAVTLEEDVSLHHWDAFATQLAQSEGPMLVDPEQAPYAVAQILLESGTEMIHGEDPCLLPKACKTPAEIAGSHEAHLRDGVAMARFLHWFDTHAPGGSLTEIDAVKQLEAFRRDTGKLRDISFDTIAGAGAHGAIVHYRVDEASNAPIRPGTLFLIDSGGQYEDGTTDITRTLPVGQVGDEERSCFTLVLQGMIAIHRARFPKGVAGAHLDALARAPLWATGRDYDHGTGHGVGSFLSVHEGPQRISRSGTLPLKPGMILSNEPGYYKEGAFGIRIENLIVVTPAPEGADPAREMLSFETLTLAPIARALIDRSLLSEGERMWLNDYHAHVEAKLGPELRRLGHEDTAQWLKKACAPL